MASHKQAKSRRIIEESEETDEEVENTPPEIRKLAEKSRDARLLPPKSAKAYNVAYQKFLKWFRSQPQVTPTTKVSESFLVAYFETQISAASGWSIHSRLKSLIKQHHGIDLSQCSQLQTLLKSKHKEHRPHQASTFSSEQIDRFLAEFPDIDCGRVKKMAVLFALSGGLRVEELTYLERSNVEVTKDGFLKVTLLDSKTGPRHFFVHPHEKKHWNGVAMYTEYLEKIGEDIELERVFLRMENGKVQNRALGKNYLADISKEAARFLGLASPDSYTSHTWRRSGATMLAESGVSTEGLRQYGGWKNAATAQIYIESTANNKKRLAETVLDSTSPTKKPSPGVAIPLQASFTAPPSLGTTQIATGAVFNQCTIHIHQ